MPLELPPVIIDNDEYNCNGCFSDHVSASVLAGHNVKDVIEHISSSIVLKSSVKMGQMQCLLMNQSAGFSAKDLSKKQTVQPDCLMCGLLKKEQENMKLMLVNWVAIYTWHPVNLCDKPPPTPR